MSLPARQAAIGLLERAVRLPIALYKYALGKWRGWHVSRLLAESAEAPALRSGAAGELLASWSAIRDAAAAGRSSRREDWAMEAALPLGELPAENAPLYTGADVFDDERELVERIRAETLRMNRNNVTRTEAYRRLYLRRQELHWALLAHMVSRNGGWNMTDLKGEWLPRLLEEESREAIFQFLERANSFIFRDAYPQLRLYEHSLQEGRSLFHLLPSFGVSQFMLPVWDRFWRERDPVPLTVALIVNEQQYIERRVVRKPYFRERVLHTAVSVLQTALQLNAVLLPYGPPGELRLAGLVMERFENLHERIEFGKRLYAVLFGVPQVHSGALAFVRSVKHSGSRADYAPELFSGEEGSGGVACGSYKERLSGGRLKPGASRLYSPTLAAAWQDRPVPYPDGEDWFRSPDAVAPYFRKVPLPPVFEMTDAYKLLLNKIELAVLAAEALRG